MGTFVNLGLVSLNTRLNEIDIILKEAKKNFEKNEPLYNALCRSAQILLSAHFEGYLKELVRNAIEDINTSSTFKASNPHLKRRFCDYFILTSPEIKKDSAVHNEKSTKLINILDNLETKFIKEYIVSYENNNPKATVIDKVAEQFGIKNFFEQLRKSDFNLIFSNTKSDNSKLSTKTKNYLLQKSNSFPYKIKLDFLGINDNAPNSDDLWNAFLSDFLKRRHDIAHGTETGNSVGHSALQEDKIKIQLLMYVFTAFICKNTNPTD
jgi:hypothetical protein